MINLIFKNSSIFFSDSVILVEWETEKVAVPNIFENWEWSEKKRKRYNLEWKNINIIDVGGKWALADWYKFSCDLFGHENVFAMIDRDPDYILDEAMIIRTIKKVYWIKHVDTSNFMQYNWIMLEWEFESYYKQARIKEYLVSVIHERSKKFWENIDQEKVRKNLHILDNRLEKLNSSKKISKAYAKLFWKYFKHYWKPTIAFNLSTYLSKNDWYKSGIINKFQYMANKLEK
jgi:predicted ATP-dependent endonuclease of OLD family